MPDGKLDANEYRLFQKWALNNVTFRERQAFPANREGIREAALYQRFASEQPQIAPPAQLSSRAFEVLATLTPEERARLPFPIPEEPLSSMIARRTRAEAEAAGVDLPTGIDVPPFPEEPPPQGFRWAFDRDLNRWVPKFTGATEQERLQRQRSQAEIELAQERFEFEKQQALPRDITPFQEEQFGFQQRQFDVQQQQFQAQLGFQQQQAQLAAQQQQRQFQSQLAANPINWLQYAAYTGQPPVVQPWMVPLGAQNDPQRLQAGQPLPGFQPQSFTGNQLLPAGSFSDLPQLTTPSAQLQSRWGPTAQAQFLGFERARTGASPQETQFRLASGRAPTGARTGFTRFA